MLWRQTGGGNATVRGDSSASRNQKQIPRLRRAAADLRRQFKDARGFAWNDKFLGWHKLGAFLGG
jgi:hypothetical protein